MPTLFNFFCHENAYDTSIMFKSKISNDMQNSESLVSIVIIPQLFVELVSTKHQCTLIRNINMQPHAYRQTINMPQLSHYSIGGFVQLNKIDVTNANQLQTSN